MIIDSSEDLNKETGWPLDWGTEIPFRGVSRATAARRYLVRLSALSTQISVGTAASQLKAARLYDMALWKLAAFQSRTLRPNFPETFSEITQARIDEEYPNLNRIYSEYATAARLSDDLTEREHREAALGHKALVTIQQPSAKDYGKYQSLVEKTRSQNMLTCLRLKAIRSLLTFTKLPALSQAATKYESSLTQAEADGRELHLLLVNHAELYKNLLDNKHTERTSCGING